MIGQAIQAMNVDQNALKRPPKSLKNECSFLNYV